MVTRKTVRAKAAAAKPTRAGPRSARKKGAPAKGGRARATATATDEKSLADLLTRLSKLELAGLAGRLVRGWRTDLEIIVQANQKSLAGLQALVEHQVSRIKNHIGEMQSVAKFVSVLGPEESARRVDDLARASVELAVDDVRQFAEAAAQSQKEAFELLYRRVVANIDEVQKLLRK